MNNSTPLVNTYKPDWSAPSNGAILGSDRLYNKDLLKIKRCKKHEFVAKFIHKKSSFDDSFSAAFGLHIFQTTKRRSFNKRQLAVKVLHPSGLKC